MVRRLAKMRRTGTAIGIIGGTGIGVSATVTATESATAEAGVIVVTEMTEKMTAHETRGTAAVVDATREGAGGRLAARGGTVTATGTLTANASATVTGIGTETKIVIASASARRRRTKIGSRHLGTVIMK